MAEFEYDVFVSYTHADQERVRQLAESLRGVGIRVWFDEWSIEPGQDILLAVEQGLEKSRVLILCLSPAALGAPWVTLETNARLFRDPNNANRRFVPVLLEQCQPPATLSRYKSIDYRTHNELAWQQLLAVAGQTVGAGSQPTATSSPLDAPIPSPRSSVPLPVPRPTAVAEAHGHDNPPITQGSLRTFANFSSPSSTQFSDENSLGKSASASRTKIEHPFDRSLVCVWVDRTIAGTGFLIAEDKVLTCAHVVSKPDGTPKGEIEVESYAAVCDWVRTHTSTARANPPSTAAPSESAPTTVDELGAGPILPVKAEIDAALWRSEDHEDVAVLNLTAAFPAPAAPLTFSTRELKPGQHFHTRGFPAMGDTHGVYDRGEVQAEAPTRSGQMQYQLQADNITHRFSGAPVCDLATGEVLGMIQAIAYQDQAGKLGGVAFAIPNTTLFSLIGWLRRSEVDPARQQQAKLVESHRRLVVLMHECLGKSDSVREDVAASIQRPDLKAASRLGELIAELQTQDPTKLVACFETLAQAYQSREDLSALQSVDGLYCALIPARIESTVAESILSRLGIPRDDAIEVPWDSMIMFEFVMARMDGRRASFLPAGTAEAPPRPALLLDPLPEQGFTQENETKNLDVLISGTARHVGQLPIPYKRSIRFEKQTVEGRAAELNNSLRAMHLRNLTPYVKAESDVSRQLSAEDLQFIHRFLTYLTVVDIKPRDSQRDPAESLETFATPIRDQTLAPRDIPSA